jgi:hypothetical protein
MRLRQQWRARNQLDALKRPLKQRALEKLANEVQLKGSALGGEAGALATGRQ